MSFENGTIVESLTTGDIGVVIGPWATQEDEVEVVFEDRHSYDQDSSMGMPKDLLKIVGLNEPIISDPSHCGLGSGELACRFLGTVDDEYQCLRFSKDNTGNVTWGNGTTNPVSVVFPECQADIQKEIQEYS
ncbi:MAG TPA: hypothetical protein VGF75_05885 [Candidatus Saccharimonadales bacterium]|jgi:hypothetical protein